MIISVSGRINSGKDTVGSIIQIVSTAPNLVGTGIITPEFIRKFQERTSQYLSTEPKDFQLKKFADKLKDITCIILGCTREQLEDREYKEKELGEEWKLWSCDLQIEHFITEEEAMKHSFMPEKVTSHNLTPRKIMQLLGTEAGRQVIHPQIWINSMFSEYRGVDKFRKETPLEPWQFPNWVITDTRFPNELQAVKERDGITIMVKRQETDHLAGDHASETSLDNSKFDYTINNDGTVEELIEKVRDILLDRGII